MATKIPAIIRIRRGSYSSWYETNPILQEGEMGLITSEQDVNKFKVGNGITEWRDLPYIIGADGKTATIEIVSTETILPELEAEVINIGTIDEAKLIFKIPKGFKGDPGTIVPDITGLLDKNNIDDEDLFYIYDYENEVLKKISASKIAPINSPIFTGNPQSPTPLLSSNNNSIATTEFVNDYFLNNSKGESNDYTYIIDSNQKLEDWANDVNPYDDELNPTGNDYSYILIKKGIYEINTALEGGTGAAPLVVIDISNGRTKKIVGEDDSKIVINNISESNTYLAVIKGIVTGTSSDDISSNNSENYEIRNVYIEKGEVASKCYVKAFYKCINVFNCSSTTLSGTNNNIFELCININNCIIGLSNQNVAQCKIINNCKSKGYFGNCNNLNNCIADNGYNYCKYLNNCISIGNQSGLGTSTEYSTLFYTSEYLTNCYADCTNMTSNVTSGFHSCFYLENCNGKSKGISYSPGSTAVFNKCKYLSNCNASAKNESSNGSSGFLECSNLNTCYGYGLSNGMIVNGTNMGGVGTGFLSCNNLINCFGSGVGVSSGSVAGKGYGFDSCIGMLLCKNGDITSTTATFRNNCYGRKSNNGSANQLQFNSAANIESSFCYASAGTVYAA